MAWRREATNMKRRTGQRDPQRLVKVLADRLAESIPVEIAPVAGPPEPVVKSAVLIRPRRPKGVRKTRKP